MPAPKSWEAPRAPLRPSGSRQGLAELGGASSLRCCFRHKGTDRQKSATGGPGPELTSLPARCLPALTCDDGRSPALQSLGDGGPALPGADLASRPPAVKLKPPGQRPPSKQRFEIRTFQGPRAPLPEVRGHGALGTLDPLLHTYKGAIPTRLETYILFQVLFWNLFNIPTLPGLEADSRYRNPKGPGKREVLSQGNSASVGPGGSSGATGAPGAASLEHGDERTAVTAVRPPLPPPLGPATPWQGGCRPFRHTQ